MFNPNFYDPDDPMAAMGFFQPGMPPRAGGSPRRFDEFYRCYPVAMLPGPERENVNHGGKVIMPPSALDKLSRLSITYPMLFELINGGRDAKTHAGVLEFIAEEGKIYLPYWMMQTLRLDPGDLVQIKSTDLPPGTFIKLQPQSPSFLDISDPKAVLENAFRNFACLTVGDTFTFAYNESVYEIAVLETKPSNSVHAISVLETDLEVDFAAPVGYEPPPPVRSSTGTPRNASGTSTPRSGIAANTGAGVPRGGILHHQGSMAAAINYASLAPSDPSSTSTPSTAANAGSNAFHSVGYKLKSSISSAPKPSDTPAPRTVMARRSGPQALRLPHGKLFFGYEIKPVPAKPSQDGDGDAAKKEGVVFKGQGQTLRRGAGGTKRSADT